MPRHSAPRHVYASVEEPIQEGKSVALRKDTVDHLRKVLRMEWDSVLCMSDGHGNLFEGTLAKTESGAEFQAAKLLRSEPRAKTQVHLVIGMPKNPTMAAVVEKSVETGACSVTAVQVSRSVVLPKEDEIAKYQRRWGAIVEEAMGQSERLWVTKVQGPLTWPGSAENWVQELVPSVGPARAVFFFVSEGRGDSLPEGANPYRYALESMRKRVADGAADIVVVIGPEGGFSPLELEQIRKVAATEKNAEILSLGSTVLRVETAAVAALTLARAAAN